MTRPIMKPCPNRCQIRHLDDDVRVVDNHISDDEEVSGHQVECRCCRMTGPLGGSEPHAIRLWNELPRIVNPETKRSSYSREDLS